MYLLLVEQNIVTDIKLPFFFFSLHIPLFLHILCRGNLACPEVALFNQKLCSKSCVNLLALTRFAQKIIDHLFMVHEVNRLDAEFHGLFEIGRCLVASTYKF